MEAVRVEILVGDTARGGLAGRPNHRATGGAPNLRGVGRAAPREPHLAVGPNPSLADGPPRRVKRLQCSAGEVESIQLDAGAMIVAQEERRAVRIPGRRDLPGEVTASWYPDGSALLLGHDHRARVELYRFDLSSGALEPLDAPRGTVGEARVRPDGEVWFSWSSAAHPSEVRSTTGRAVVRPPGEPAPGGVPYEDLDPDGLHVMVAKPRGDEPHPVLFMVHGGPTWHDRDAFSPSVQAWVDHGFAVALVNYRGSTGYGKEWREAIAGTPDPTAAGAA